MGLNMKERHLAIMNIEDWQENLENYIKKCYRNPKRKGGYPRLEEAVLTARIYGCSTIVSIYY